MARSATHPLQEWMDTHGVTYEDAARLCRRLGVRRSPGYIMNVARGWNRPRYDFAKALSEMTGGVISITAIMDFAYTRNTNQAA